ncbi:MULTISPECIES: hypothetical protein [Actinomycetes]|uniref:hypothetical protein n=1 Tax=Aeromicrobium tamlense TaxID=375541 RepID=UPI0031D377AD
MQRTYASTTKDGIRVFNHEDEWDDRRHLDRGQARFDRDQVPDLIEALAKRADPADFDEILERLEDVRYDHLSAATVNAQEGNLEFNYRKFVPDYCPNCGSDDLEHRGYWVPSSINSGRWPAMLRCGECGPIQAATFVVEDSYEPPENSLFDNDSVVEE